MSAILNNALKGEKIFLQFGGQGSPYLKELAALFQNPALSELFTAIFAALDDCRRDPEVAADFARYWPNGFDLKSWLENPASAPGDDALAAAPLSLPLIGLTQIGHYYHTLQKGWSADTLYSGAVAGLTGHSQGIIVAALAALGTGGSAYVAHAALFFKYLFYVGYRAQQAYGEYEPAAEWKNASQALGDKGLSPMAAVLSCSAADLQAMVNELNQTLPAENHAHVSLYNTPDSNIISARPVAQVKLRERFKETMDARGIKLVYLKVSAPFHSPLVKSAAAPFAGDLKKIGWNIRGADLKAPVYSIRDGRDYRQEADLGQALFREVVIEELHWSKAIASLINPSPVAAVVDFGPGKTSVRLTESWLAGKNIRCIPVVMPKDFQSLFV